MSDNNMSLVPDVIKSASEAVQANIPETAKQTDGVLLTVVGFFNHVVLYPVRKANLNFKYKLEEFEKDLQEKTKDTPDENLQIPPTSIAGPVLEALRYTYDEEGLREMYENLLASAMDNRTASHAHPAFVDAIRQMSSLDAKVISLVAQKGQFRCAEIVFVIKGTGKIYAYGMPNYFLPEMLDLGSPFDISASITNLERLGLINIYNNGLANTDYNELKEHLYVQERKKLFDIYGEEIELELQEQAISINDYGHQFVKICLREEATHAN